jgi:hypothetical protein
MKSRGSCFVAAIPPWPSKKLLNGPAFRAKLVGPSIVTSRRPQEVSMAKQAAAGIRHGGILLPTVEVISYNVELKVDEG